MLNESATTVPETTEPSSIPWSDSEVAAQALDSRFPHSVWASRTRLDGATTRSS
jgi:hypothetical protein